jgi:hypothetical protein
LSHSPSSSSSSSSYILEYVKKNTLVLFEAHLTLVTSVQLHHTFLGYSGSLVAMSGSTPKNR